MNIVTRFLISLFVNHCLIAQLDLNNQNNIDPLSETPLFSIPSEMTYEEYKDMNRRFNIAIAWSAIPIPGITHYYAGEKKLAKRLFYIGLGGFTSIILGTTMNSEPSWPEDSSRYVINNLGTNDEAWYEKIPVSMENDQTNYRLKKINKTSDDAGGLFIAVGFLILIGDFVYDRLWGIKKIEEKRDKVRFKYGKELKFSLSPKIDFSRGEYGLALSKGFNLKRK
mgnify:CR=1 FL=1